MVLKEKSLPLMRMFQKVLYSADEVNLNEATSNILSLKDEFPNFRKNEWVLMFRRDIITKGNNTNNYAEACIRILKEIILNRTKAYNVVALVEFICYVWEDETCYSVLSSKSENSVYTVDIQIGVCNCYVGFTGAFCKH
ncbi:SWIM-type domain-containing protein [Aphis craccivora]|uniref:SWIM-type domain-containing protein n=1 Tax=Aphis craccivora TaxID=307492 RepID=A0A6G0VS65_APHCR|nr:SWIM-type domain-containing protein [Aphis craccivora]